MEWLGYRKVPVIIRVLSEDDSILSMVDSNLHRERISYSEKAFVYKLKNDVLKRKSGRKKSQVDHKTPRKRTTFNAPSTMNGYYQAEVNHDMPGLVR